MEQLQVITQLAQLGATGILLVVLWNLWQEYKEQNKFIRDLLLQGEAERKVLAQKIGLDTQTLTTEAQAVRRDLAARNLHNDQRN